MSQNPFAPYGTHYEALRAVVRFGQALVERPTDFFALCMRHRLNPSEFARWLSVRDRRGIPAGSAPDRRFRQALEAAIAELESTSVRGLSHRNLHASQFTGSRPQ